jgi:hypothetical protein
VSETAAALCGSMAAIAASGTEQEEAWRGGPSPLDPHAERAGEGVHRPEMAREQRRWATLLGRRPRAETAAADSKSVWGKVGGHNRPQGVGGREVPSTTHVGARSSADHDNYGWEGIHRRGDGAGPAVVKQVASAAG